MIGYHLMLDGALNEAVTGEMVEEMLSSLPAEIDMQILEGPVVVEGLPGNPGWTGFVVIDKSHIAIHTFEEGDRIAVDVFSCKTFEKDIVEKYLVSSLPLKTYNLRFIERSEETL